MGFGDEIYLEAISLSSLEYYASWFKYVPYAFSLSFVLNGLKIILVRKSRSQVVLNMWFTLVGFLICSVRCH